MRTRLALPLRFLHTMSGWVRGPRTIHCLQVEISVYYSNGQAIGARIHGATNDKKKQKINQPANIPTRYWLTPDGVKIPTSEKTRVIKSGLTAAGDSVSQCIYVEKKKCTLCNRLPDCELAGRKSWKRRPGVVDQDWSKIVRALV